MSGTLPQAFRLLGGNSVTHLGPEDLAANAGEELADTARLLSHVVDCIVVRIRPALCMTTDWGSKSTLQTVRAVWYQAVTAPP